MSSIKKGKRIYEYRDQDGNTFWSFHRYPSVVTHSRTLTIEDRVGTPFDTYLSDLRAIRRIILEEEKEKDLAGIGIMGREGDSHE